MSERFELDGKVAVVTGAASGIGRAIAQSLARRGCHLALADVNEEGLEETARLVGNAVRVTRHRLDVADRDAVTAFPAEVTAAHGAVDIVVNNAGVALGGTFAHSSVEDFDWLMRINFDGVVQMTRAFLPLLKKRPVAQIVNLSSLFGLIAPPGQTAYCAAKFAVRGFSESLRQELVASKSPVGITVVHPGGVRTGIATSARLSANLPPELMEKQRARFARALKMPPEEAGEIIVRGIERRRPRVLVGNDAKVAATIERLMPVRYWRLLGARDGMSVGGLARGVAAVGGGLALFSSVSARRAERSAPRDGGFVEVDGTRLHYVDIGRGPAIVMVHGLASQLRSFTYALAETLASDFRVIAMDRPGSGYSSLPPPGRRTLRAQGALIGRFVETLGLDRPLLVGHSLGGALSLSLALDRPELLRGLALVSPLTQPVDGVPGVFRAFHHPSPLRRRIIAHTLAVPMGHLGSAKARHVIFSPDPVPDDYATRGGGALALRPSAFFAASTEVSLGTGELVGMAARYPSLGVPLGILFGRGDRILPPAIHGERTAAAVPGAELALIDGGHMIPLTAPDATAEFIRRRHATPFP